MLGFRKISYYFIILYYNIGSRLMTFFKITKKISGKIGDKLKNLIKKNTN